MPGTEHTVSSQGDVHSGLNAYTATVKTDTGRKLAQVMVTVVLTSRYAPDASHTHLRPVLSVMY